MIVVKRFSWSFILFLVLDFIWLGFVMKPFNSAQLAEIGRFKNGEFDVLLFPAALVYVCMALLVAVFVLPRVSQNSNLLKAFGWGALAGFCAYGIYDLTNLAILKNYPIPFAMADVAWGTFLFGTVTAMVHKVTK